MRKSVLSQIVLELAALLIAPLAARADNRPLLVVAESIDIKASPASIWDVVSKFSGLQDWHPAFSDKLIKGQDGQLGAVRQVTVKGGGPTFTEELLALDAPEMAFTYGIVESPLAIDHYRSTMTVRPNVSGGSTVVWIGNFMRKNPSENPPAAESDGGVVKFVSGAYEGGLQNLKKMMESNK